MCLVITEEPLFPRHQKCNHIFLSSVVIKLLTFDLNSLHLSKTVQQFSLFLLEICFIIYVQYSISWWVSWKVLMTLVDGGGTKEGSWETYSCRITGRLTNRNLHLPLSRQQRLWYDPKNCPTSVPMHIQWWCRHIVYTHPSNNYSTLNVMTLTS